MGPDITNMCRNIAFFEVRAEILLSWNQGGLDSRAGPFLGYVQIYSFWEKYSPLNGTSVDEKEDQNNVNSEHIQIFIRKACQSQKYSVRIYAPYPAISI